jgi:hypothetical protein
LVDEIPGIETSLDTARKSAYATSQLRSVVVT